MAIAARSIAEMPMAEINTTPLIDVMLVLLVMFIITIPVAPHIVEVNLPGSVRTHIPVEVRQENTLSITPSGDITWNGTAISKAELALTLKASLTIKPEPLLKYEPDPQAPYGAAAEVLGLVKQSGVEAFGFVGNDRYGSFTKASAER
jgi:biopolymer transport protein ExbD